jgi:hypothetical protein
MSGNHTTSWPTSASRPSSGSPPTSCATTWTRPSTSTSCSASSSSSTSPTPSRNTAPSSPPARATTPGPIPRTRTSTRPRTSSGCRSRRPLVPPPGQRQAAHHRQARGRRHGRHRARQPAPQGRPPQGLRPAGLDKHRLGELIDLIGTIAPGRPGQEPRQGLLGRVYEYFLTQFASAEGKNGGQFYTPSCVVRCLVEMLAPYKGRIYDPCCGSAACSCSPKSSWKPTAASWATSASTGRRATPPPAGWR